VPVSILTTLLPLRKIQTRELASVGTMIQNQPRKLPRNMALVSRINIRHASSRVILRFASRLLNASRNASMPSWGVMTFTGNFEIMLDGLLVFAESYRRLHLNPAELRSRSRLAQDTLLPQADTAEQTCCTMSSDISGNIGRLRIPGTCDSVVSRLETTGRRPA